MMKKRVRVSWRQCNTSDTVRKDMSKPSGPSSSFKNKYNLECHRSDVSEIKLKRTDTTLDLSQKAKRAEEKRRAKGVGEGVYIGVWEALVGCRIMSAEARG